MCLEFRRVIDDMLVIARELIKRFYVVCNKIIVSFLFFLRVLYFDA